MPVVVNIVVAFLKYASIHFHCFSLFKDSSKQLVPWPSYEPGRSNRKYFAKRSWIWGTIQGFLEFSSGMGNAGHMGDFTAAVISCITICLEITGITLEKISGML
jgi:hypothetical protein